MRRLLRRLAWLVTRLLFVLVLSFLVLSRATRAPAGSTADYSTDRLEETSLPTLFNARPADLEMRIDIIVERLSHGPSEPESRELLRLGGATLPLLLARLPSLPLELRTRIAWDLLPVAQRMTWRGANEVTSPGQAYDYFLEMWKERSVDYQPTIVARWVERLASRGGGALTASVLEYDTYALASLIAALPEVTTDADVERARPLLAVMRRITGLPWVLPTPCGVDEARSTIDHWRRWWRLHAIEYTTVRGPSRWSAMLTQTRFGQWAALALQHRFGCTRDQYPIAARLRSAALRSVSLLIAGTLGAVAVTLLKRRRWLTAAPTSRSALAMLAFMSVPQTAIVAFLAAAGLVHGPVAAAVVACIAIAHLDLENIHQPESEGAAGPDAMDDAIEPRPRSHLPNWLFAGHTWPFLLTLVFVIEHAFGVYGLGQCCIDAFRHSDLHMLMAITTITALWLLLIELAVQLNNPLWHRRPALEPQQ